MEKLRWMHKICFSKIIKYYRNETIIQLINGNQDDISLE